MIRSFASCTWDQAEGRPGARAGAGSMGSAAIESKRKEVEDVHILRLGG